MRKIDLDKVISKIDSFEFMCFPPHYPSVAAWNNSFNYSTFVSKVSNYFRNDQKRALGIYINIPLCDRKCSFCFLDVMTYSKEKEELILNGIINELKILKDCFLEKHSAMSLYIAGGTVTILSEKGLEKFFSAIVNTINFQKNFQFTIETSPKYITSSKVKILSRYGVNLVMMGVQSFNENKNKKFNRYQSIDSVKNAVGLLKKNNININFDIITGLGNLDEKDFLSEIFMIKKLEPDMVHLNKFKPIYDPAIKKRILYLQKKGLGVLKKYGYIILDEESCAKPKVIPNIQGSINFQTFSTIIGVGPNSISHIYSIMRYKNFLNIKNYIDYISNNKLPVESLIFLNEYDEAINCLFNFLNSSKGVNILDLKKFFSKNTYKKILKKLKELELKKIVNFDGLYYRGNEKWFELSISLYKESYLNTIARKYNFFV